MLGGRVGYALFYDHSLLNPLQFVQVWKGGLAFHGGLGGVGLAVWLFCRRHNVQWARAADSCALAVTPGILAVRIANFIHGELYGRPTGKDTLFAMQFPTDPVSKQLLGLNEGLTMRDHELCIQVAYHKRTFADVRPLLSDVDEHGQKIDWDRVAQHLDWPRVSAMTDAKGELFIPHRHPSQIYEGLCEGLLLGIVLLLVYRATRHRPLRPGAYAVIFLLGYSIARVSLELVRQPDPQLGPNVLFGLTMGQLLSVGLVLFAIAILWWQRRSAHRGPADPAE
jgi:phosphatidylglycerol:prolipoprotein diacylglycerol transferase